jgi:hypothetical protein
MRGGASKLSECDNVALEEQCLDGFQRDVHVTLSAR